MGQPLKSFNDFLVSSHFFALGLESYLESFVCLPPGDMPAKFCAR